MTQHRLTVPDVFEGFHVTPAVPIRPCMDADSRKHAERCDPANCPAHGCFAWTNWSGRQKRTTLRRWATEAVEADLAAPELDCDDPLQPKPEPTQHRRRGASQYRGVSWFAASRYWRVAIWIGDKRINLGSYKDEHDAARAYNAAVLEHGLPRWRLNVIEEEEL